MEIFHDILYYGIFPHVWYIAIAVALTIIFVFLGAAVFFHYEKRFPEML